MEKIKEIVKKSASKFGLVLVEVVVKQDNIEAVLYSPIHDVSIGELELVTREIQARLSEIGLDGVYSINLSSPGMDRILKTENELNIFKGKLVKISILSGEKMLTEKGVLRGTDGEYLLLEMEGKIEKVELKKVASVRLWDKLFEKGGGRKWLI